MTPLSEGQKYQGRQYQLRCLRYFMDVMTLICMYFTSHKLTELNFFIRCCTIKHKCYFSQITAKWNSLPANVKYAPNSNIFKNSLVNVTKFIDQFYIFD